MSSTDYNRFMESHCSKNCDKRRCSEWKYLLVKNGGSLSLNPSSIARITDESEEENEKELIRVVSEDIGPDVEPFSLSRNRADRCVTGFIVILSLLFILSGLKNR